MSKPALHHPGVSVSTRRFVFNDAARPVQPRQSIDTQVPYTREESMQTYCHYLFSVSLTSPICQMIAVMLECAGT